MEGKVDNRDLLAAGLRLMGEAGKPLTKVPTGSRAMLYSTPNGETVRVRTCNDHILVVLADEANPEAKLNIEGTDHLLVVMPEVPRQSGRVLAYLVPAEVAAQAARQTHADWLASSPSTNGNNRTWNLWFDDSAKAGGFAKKWAQYRLHGEASTSATLEVEPHGTQPSLGAVIADARRRIAAAAGVAEEAVKISVVLD